MKKLIVLLAFSFLALSVFAQNYKPRFGIKKNEDNTGLSYTYGYVQPTVTGTTLSITGAAFNYNETVVNLTTLPSNLATLTISSVTKNSQKYADQLTFMGYGGTTNQIIVFRPTVTLSIPGYITASDVTSTGIGKAFLIEFMYNGFNWIEKSRLIK